MIVFGSWCAKFGRLVWISADIANVLQSPDLKARLSELGLQPVGTTPEQFDAYIRAEIDKWAKVVTFSGAKVD